MSAASTAAPLHVAPLLPADGNWMLSRVVNGMSLDNFDPDDLPHPYPQVIAAGRAAQPGPNVLAAINAELDKLPVELRVPISAAVNTTDPRVPRAAPISRSRTAGQLLHADLPLHRWLVDGLLVRPGLTLLGGQPKVGKSWLSLQLAQAVALGDRGKDERTIARTLKAFGPTGAILDDIITSSGLRRPEAVAALGELVKKGEALFDKLPRRGDHAHPL